MAALTEAGLLATWEDGLEQNPAVRAARLAALAGGADVADVVQLPLGGRDGLIFDLRESCFGTALRCEVDCPACGERLEIDISTTQLRAEPAPATNAEIATPDGTVTVRPVIGADLLDLDREPDDAHRRSTVIRRCVLDRPAELSDAVIEAVAAQLAELDPQADLTISLSCESCGHEWEDPFDIGAYLWAELDAYARRLLYEVHALALAYGWSEAETLAVSPHRRRLYIEAVPA